MSAERATPCPRRRQGLLGRTESPMRVTSNDHGVTRGFEVSQFRTLVLTSATNVGMSSQSTGSRLPDS